MQGPWQVQVFPAGPLRWRRATPSRSSVSAAIQPEAENQISLLCTRDFLNKLGTGGLLAPVVVYREK